MRMTKTLPQNRTKCDFVNVSVVIKSFFLDYRHNVSLNFRVVTFATLNVMSLYLRDFFGSLRNSRAA